MVAFALAVGVGIGLLAPSPAFAQRANRARVEKLNTEALAAYDDLEFDKARKLLRQALAIARRGGVPASLRARTHMKLGVVYAAGLKDPTRGLEEFVKALRLDPEIQLDPSLKTPKLAELFLRAKESLNLAGSEPPPVGSLQHTPVETGTPGQPVTISVLAPAGIEIGRIEVHFRTTGRGGYNVGLLERRGSRSFVGEIPGPAVTAAGLQYYLEAKSIRGRVVARSGSASQPHQVNVLGGGSSGIIPGQPPPPPDDGPKPLPFKRFSLSLGLGIGAGYLQAGATPDVTSPGFALAPFHIAAELGVAFAGQWQAGAQARIQVVQFAGLGEARIKRHFGSGKFRGNLHLGAGGGQARLRLPLQNAEGVQETTIYVPRGVGTASAGGGFTYRFTAGLGLMADLSVRFLFPQFAPLIDFTTGLEFYF